MKGVLKFKGIKPGIGMFLLVFFCCQSSDQKPANVLSQEEMVRVLTDIYITEEKIARLSLPTDSASRVFDLLESRVFEKLEVPDSVFRESLDYYTDHPAEMEKVYAALVDSLQLREQRTPHVSAPEQ